MTPCLLVLASLLPADATAPVDEPPSPSAVRVEDAGELQGEWEVVSVVIGGHDLSSLHRGDRAVFVGMTVRAVLSGGKVAGPFTFRVDAARRPQEIYDAKDEGRQAPGIYRRTGDELLFATADKGEPRPSSFEPAKGVEVWTLKRVRR